MLCHIPAVEIGVQFVPRIDCKKTKKYSPCGRAGGFHMLSVSEQGLAVLEYGGTRVFLNALPMKTSNA